MMKKKRGRPPKKKPTEPFIEKAEVAVAPEKPSVQHLLCECGKGTHPGSHQCWSCSHRA